jgi:hypothetical protein
VHLSTLRLLNDLLLSFRSVGLALALDTPAALVGLALVDKLVGVGMCALVLVAAVLRVAFNGAEGALVGVATRGGGFAKCPRA